MTQMYEIRYYDSEKDKWYKCDEIEIDERLSNGLQMSILREIVAINKKEQNGASIKCVKVEY